jgi:hypothetical protein
MCAAVPSRLFKQVAVAQQAVLDGPSGDMLHLLHVGWLASSSGLKLMGYVSKALLLLLLLALSAAALPAGAVPQGHLDGPQQQLVGAPAALLGCDGAGGRQAGSSAGWCQSVSSGHDGLGGSWLLVNAGCWCRRLQVATTAMALLL